MEFCDLVFERLNTRDGVIGTKHVSGSRVKSVDGCWATCGIGQLLYKFEKFSVSFVNAVEVSDRDHRPFRWLRIGLRTSYEGWCGSSHAFSDVVIKT
jgi:hypothetical protein